ncbi:slowpoke-binding protein-like [Liolophura sinensis]|uniref:slowpoke-binding protein-like n=1 Tax=Liolophura sinensis TaxID=3198878 RepID=UPI003158EA77
MAEDSLTWISDHLWVPIVASLALIIVIALLIWLACHLCRSCHRYDYTALQQDMALPEKIRIEQKMQLDAVRDTALMNCGFYLRAKRSFTIMEHLSEIGNRVDSHWFMVSDARTESSHILTMFPRSSQMALPFTVATKKQLSELFLLLKHPYIYPISEVDFILEQGLIASIYPYNPSGSLKDLICHVNSCLDPWSMKYAYRGDGLQLGLIQLFGKQILQALLFLQSKGLPPHGHVHSGNVMICNRICRLSSCESSLVSLTPRLQPLVQRKLREEGKDSIDSISFGHLLYEMSAGCVLDTPTPQPRHLVHCPHEVIQVMNFIFPADGTPIPSIQQIYSHEFFKYVKLKENEMFNEAPIHFSPGIKSLLKAVKKGKPYKSKSRKRSTTTSENESVRRPSRQNSAFQEETVFGPSSPPPAPPLPPPPPPGAPSVDSEPPSYSSVMTGRGALLSDIQHGTKLKRTLTDDRSAPRV